MHKRPRFPPCSAPLDLKTYRTLSQSFPSLNAQRTQLSHRHLPDSCFSSSLPSSNPFYHHVTPFFQLPLHPTLLLSSCIPVLPEPTITLSPLSPRLVLLKPVHHLISYHIPTCRPPIALLRLPPPTVPHSRMLLSTVGYATRPLDRPSRRSVANTATQIPQLHVPPSPFLPPPQTDSFKMQQRQ